MATTSFSKLDQQLLEDLRFLLWGTNLKDDVFMRWTQGFVFSKDEPTALLQLEGGPCAVIAPVQGFLLKNALFTSRMKTTTDLASVTGEQAVSYLCEALCELLEVLETDSFLLLSLEPAASASPPPPNQSSSPAPAPEPGESSPKRRKIDQETFHSKLKCKRCEGAQEMREHLKDTISEYQQDYGVLLYLYSLLLTKGLEQIKNEMEDPSEPMIDGIHGHGSQSLINLFLTSRAISNVWDNDKEVCGLKLQGIKQQSTVGFLTLLEHLRYCEVGWYLKNPCFPVWLLGSETHLTVLFSPEKRLVVSETPASNARTIFAQFDPEGNGFVSATLLGDILAALDLVSEKEYVDIMCSKLDAEELGVITRAAFMEEFFPEDDPTSPSKFTLLHYNGLPRSSLDKKVQYRSCQCELKEELEVQIITDVSAIRLCVQTKWPTLELSWGGANPPSLN